MSSSRSDNLTWVFLMGNWMTIIVDLKVNCNKLWLSYSNNGCLPLHCAANLKTMTNSHNSLYVMTVSILRCSYFWILVTMPMINDLAHPVRLSVQCSINKNNLFVMVVVTITLEIVIIKVSNSFASLWRFYETIPRIPAVAHIPVSRLALVYIPDAVNL